MYEDLRCEWICGCFKRPLLIAISEKPRLITLAMSGKVLLMVDGYTFHKGRGDWTSGGIRWRCSSVKKKCTAYIVLSEDDKDVLKMRLNHNNHERPNYKETKDGTYVKL
ncbi:unnamed protein product, partial [Iphiclides podalirius]